MLILDPSYWFKSNEENNTLIEGNSLWEKKYSVENDNENINRKMCGMQLKQNLEKD